MSYLLHGLEEHNADIVILASNLRENINSTFTRRFHVTPHFSRRAQDLHRPLRRTAVPETVSIDGVDFDMPTRHDLTGGGIMSRGSDRCLLAADPGSVAIRMEHMVQGLARQFKREARLLGVAELGPFADLTREA